MPTARNARGVDVIAYSQDGIRKLTIQVKSLSKGSPVPLGKHLDHLFADFLIICRHLNKEKPECFIITPKEVKRLAHRGVKGEKVSFWLQPKSYGTDEYREKWERIGQGTSGDNLGDALNS